MGIPLYLTFGGRKFRRARARKPRLQMLAAPAAVLRDRLAAGDDAPLTERATRLEWLDDGIVAYEALLGEIHGARRSIRIVTFVVGDDEAGRAILDALALRAAEGVEVLLLLDDLLRFRAPRRHLARLTAAGGRARRFMPIVHVPFRARSNLRNHRKIALFDGERAIAGGMNLADEYMGPAPRADRWRDLSVLVSGSCVATLDGVFRSDWSFAAGETLPPASPGRSEPTEGAPVQVVPSGPDEFGDAIYDALLQAIFSARHRIWIATPYFVPDDPLARALEIAVRRHVEVYVVVPTRSNYRLVDLVAAPILRDLSSTVAGTARSAARKPGWEPCRNATPMSTGCPATRRVAQRPPTPRALQHERLQPGGREGLRAREAAHSAPTTTSSGTPTMRGECIHV